MANSDVEFIPGPSLNLICGFNGTGKSSIVAAIGIGLGCKLTSLLRSDKPQDFVKHNTEFAQIDIDLHQGMPNNSLATISRRIDLTGASEWHINGKKVPQKAVAELTASLMIQVDNMCAFLSQDKVAHFARLSPTEFLELTETACNPHLLELHKNLTKLQATQKSVAAECKERDQTFESLNERKKALEADVKILQRKEQFIKRKELLKRKRPWILYGNAKEQTTILAERCARTKEALAVEEAKRQPLRLLLEERKAELMKSEGELKRIDAEFERLDAQRREHGDSLETQEARQDEAKVQLESLEARRKEQDSVLAALEQEVEKMAALLDAIPSDQQAELKYAEVQRQNAHVTAEIEEIEERRRACETKLNVVKRKERDWTRKLEELQDVKERRIKKAMELTRLPFLYDLYLWVNKARKEGKFQKQVFGPVFLELNVTNELHAKYLENVISFPVRQAYIVQCKADWMFLVDNTKRNKWQVQVIDGSGPIQRPMPKPTIPPEQVPGIKGYLDSLVNCADEVKKTLCSQSQLQDLAFVEDSADPVAMYRLLAKTRQDSHGVHTLLSAEDCYSVKFSKYDSRARIVQCSKLTPATGLFAAVEDAGERKSIQAQIDGAREEQKVLEAELSEVLRPKEAKEEEAARLRDLLHELTKSKSRRKQAIARLEHARDKLKQAQEANGNLEKKKVELENQLGILMNARFKKVLQLKAIITQWTTVALSRAGPILNKTQLTIIVKQLAEVLETSNEQLSKMKKSVVDAEKEHAEKMNESRSLKAAAHKVAPLLEPAKEFEELGEPGCTYRDLFRQSGMPDTLEEIDALIAELETQASAVVAQQGVMQQYSELKDQISELDHKRNDGAARLESLMAELKTKLDEWLPALSTVVAKISEDFSQYFAAIGCKGEIKLSNSGEDFSSYALEILVSFRDKAPMQRLDVHVQSGGERSVATMLFLLCLQKVTDCPFRVVDEINQAMDPKNERMIFDRISASAQCAGTPQYFLVTPKLMPGLHYSDETTIHFVYNGAWLQCNRWSTEDILKLAKEKR